MKKKVVIKYFIIFYVFLFINFYSCSKDDNISNKPNTSLLATWNFAGMIDINGDTTLTTLNSSCAIPCFTLQISDTSQFNYFAKAAGIVVMAANVQFNGDSIIVPS